MKNFEELVKNSYPKVLGAALRILKNREDAEDCVQQALLKAFEKQDTFAGKSAFSTWLTRITINTALMKMRYDSSRPHVNFSSLESETRQENISTDAYYKPVSTWMDITDPHPDPERLYSAKEQTGLLLNSLSPLLHNTMILHYLEGMNDREVAKKLGTTKNAIKLRLSTGRRHARRKAMELGVL